MPGPRMHSCLHCIYFACYAGHIQDHSKTKKHFLYVDLSYGNIYCAQCQDYIYDRELTEIGVTHKLKEAKYVHISLFIFLFALGQLSTFLNLMLIIAVVLGTSCELNFYTIEFTFLFQLINSLISYSDLWALACRSCHGCQTPTRPWPSGVCVRGD